MTKGSQQIIYVTSCKYIHPINFFYTLPLQQTPSSIYLSNLLKEAFTKLYERNRAYINAYLE